MKRHLSVLACLVLVLAFVFSLASCGVINKILGKDPEPEHTHNFVEGKCECGETDPDYKPDEGDEGDEGDEPVGPTTAGTAEDPHALTVPGTLEINFAGGMEPVWYAFTAAESETLKVTLGSDNACMGYGLATNEMFYTDGETSVTVELEAGTKYYVAFCSLDNAAAQYTVTAEYVVSPYEVVIHEGKGNVVTFSAAEIEAGEASRKLVITNASTYMFKGDIFVSKVVAADDTEVTKNADYSYTLAAGEYTLTFGMFNIYGTAADTGVSLNVEDQDKEDDGGDDPIGPIDPVDPTLDPIDETSDIALGNNTVALTAEEIEEGYKLLNIKVNVKNTYTISITGPSTVGINFVVGEGPMADRFSEGELTPGEYTIMISCVDATAGDYTVNLAIKEADTTPDGSEDNPYVLETIPSELTFTGNHDKYYTYTATEAATIVINKVAGSYMSITAEDYDSEYNEDYSNSTYTIYIAAGETIKLNPWCDSSEENADSLVWTYTFTVSAPILAGSVDKPVDIDTYGANNSLDQPGSDDDGYIYFVKTLYLDGTLTLNFTGAVDVKYGTDLEALTSVSAQTSVVIDVADGDKVYVLVKGDSAVTFTAVTAYKLGTQNNPIVLENWTGDQTCTYTGSDVWYEITGGEEGGYVVLSSSFATAKLGAGTSPYSISYNSDTEYGSVRFYVEAGQTAYVVISNWEGESAEIAFNLTFTAGEHELDGSYKYPYVAVVGDNTCAFPGGWSYVWYKIETTATGYLTVSSANELATFVISPSTSEYATGAKIGTGSVSYGSNAGVCYIGVKTTDDSAAEIAFTVSFEEGELQPDGTLILPYTAVEGENTCAFPGGADLIWYTITVEEACTITVSSTVESAWLVLTTVDQYEGVVASNVSMFGEVTGDISATVDAGKYLIGVADWNEEEISIPFSIVCEQESSAVTPTEVAGSITDLGDNAFTLEENSYVLIPLQVMGLYELTWTDSNIVVEFKESGMAPFVQISSGAVANLNPRAGAELKVYLKDYAAGTATINVAEYVDTPVDAVVGDNTVNVVDTTNGKVVNLPVSGKEVTYIITPGTNAVVVYDYTNYLAGETVEITVAANATVSFNVGTQDWSASEVVVNVAIKPLPTLALGENSVTISEAEVTNGKKFEFTVKSNASGTYYFLSDGVEAKIYDADNNLVGTNIATLTAGNKSVTYTVVVTAAAAETYTLNIYRALPMGSTSYNGVALEFAYIATADGVLTLTSGAALGTAPSFNYSVNGGDAASFAVSTTVEIELVAGDLVIVNISGSGYSSITSKFAVPPTEIAGAINNLGDNAFTLEENSYVLIPLQVMGLYELTWTDSNIVVEFKESGRAPFVQISSGAVANLNPMAGAELKVYLKDYAAGTATINVAEYVDTPVNAVVGDNTVNVVDTQFGKVVNLPVSDAEVTYVVTPGNNAVVIYDSTSYLAGETVEITVAANATVSFNVATADYAAGDVVVNVAVKGEEGGEVVVAGPSGTYVSEVNSNGKIMTVVIDAAAGTMTVTRSNSDGSGTSTANCTYAYADGEVTYAKVGASSLTSITFKADGTPDSVMWMGASYTNYTKQA